MNYHFMESVKSQIEQYNEEILKDHVHLPSLNQAVWTGFEDAFETTTSRDSTASNSPLHQGVVSN